MDKGFADCCTHLLLLCADEGVDAMQGTFPVGNIPFEFGEVVNENSKGSERTVDHIIRSCRRSE